MYSHRPCHHCRAAEQCDELATIHSIWSLLPIALDVAEIGKPRHKCIAAAICVLGGRREAHVPNAGKPLPPPRTRRERRRSDCATEQRNEIAALQSIVSHVIRHGQGLRITGYPASGDQSAGTRGRGEAEDLV